MELKDFIKNVLIDLDSAISEANLLSKHEIRLKGVKETRTAVEFDVAVTVESSDDASGRGGIKVWGIVETSADVSSQQKHSTVSRVSFGVDIDSYTRVERNSSKIVS